tara:strand:- start:896 stop:1354 length:459 start_codon:yes stop_codon:yes gene_type:complete
MRKIYKNFINEEEANKLIKDKGTRIPLLDTHVAKRDVFRNNFIVEKIIKKLKVDFNFEVKDKSYWSIESKQSGHKWHKDTGSNNHMMWCQVGVSLLLQDGDGGGETYYADDDKETNKIKSNRKLYDLVAHTSDEWHMVTPHTGERVVFLMFI